MPSATGNKKPRSEGSGDYEALVCGAGQNAPWQCLNFLPDPHGHGSLRRVRAMTSGLNWPLGPVFVAHFVLPGHRVEMGFTKLGGGLRLGRLDLEMAHLGGDQFAQIGQKQREQLERFLLVFVERIALGQSAPAHHFRKVIERYKMLAPQPVDRLQNEAFFDLAHGLGPDARRLGRRIIIGHLDDTLAQHFHIHAFLVGPLGQRGLDAQIGLARRAELFCVPLLGIGALGRRFGDDRIHDVVAHVGDGFGDVFGIHQLDALFEDHLALIVHHVIVFEDILADIEIVPFDAGLGALDGLGDHGVGNRFPVFQSQRSEDLFHAFGEEPAHQIVLQRDEEFRPPRIALTARTAAQLVVDTTAFVPLGADHHQPACRQRFLFLFCDIGLDLGGLFLKRLVLDTLAFIGNAHFQIAAKLDVGPATGHVCGNRDGARHTRRRDDLGFLLMMAGVEDGDVLDPLFLEEVRKHLRTLDRGGADQNRLVARAALDHLVGDGLELFLDRAIDLVVLVDTRDRHVGGHGHNVQPVDIGKFGRLGIGRAGHAGQLCVKPGNNSGR